VVSDVVVAVDVIEEPRRAQALLQEARIQLLENLAEPSSAAALARKLDLPRQRVNYHLRELEAQRLVELVEERRKGTVVERIYRRTGQSYAISTAALGGLGTSPKDIHDRFSSAFQIALASQAIRDLATLQAGADAAQKKLPTFALEVEVRFASAATRSAFADDLAAAVADLVRKHHDEKARNGRTFRFYLGGYPRPKT
jgi:DNA-binding transcriptional ArsR family regulator